MLSERDRRILRDIEQYLEADDPVLASSAHRHAVAERRSRLRHDVTTVSAAVLAIACLLLPGATAAGLAAGAVACFAFAVRQLRFPAARWAVPMSRFMGRRRGHPQRRPGQGTSI